MSKIKIVLAEDDTTLSKYLKASFDEDGGFEVFTAMDGEEAIKIITSKVPDMVLLDIIMPKKNGFEVLEAIKANAKTKKIPVIMLSNLSQEKDVEQAKELGANDFFVKVDFETSEIIAKVKAVMKK